MWMYVEEVTNLTRKPRRPSCLVIYIDKQLKTPSNHSLYFIPDLVPIFLTVFALIRTTDWKIVK